MVNKLSNFFIAVFLSEFSFNKKENSTTALFPQHNLYHISQCYLKNNTKKYDKIVCGNASWSLVFPR
ncbi:hypothetical protein SRED_003075 (plasmid) [Spiroplasma melliferum]|uniref:Spiroplasmavirus-related protein n=1 Tax=Spiroplasma melliferum TaxID=2134 RepID=A0ABX5U934_SPIME|nr:hypothetical protein SRED_003054 [Spiroplasma melliferum]QCO23213.1 hypothetical protein SRED_003075 [Spiroplasma melliferum]